jgi:hypothetical protein
VARCLQKVFIILSKFLIVSREYWKAHNAHPANCPKPSSTKYKEDYFECTIEMARRAMLLPFPTLEINSNNAISDADQNPGY